MSVTFEKLNENNVKVLVDGRFHCWLTHTSRVRQNALTRERVSWWQATVNGREITATTLGAAKKRIVSACE